MPVTLVSNLYTDVYGNTSSYYKANSGDTVSVKHTISTEIFVRSTQSNSMSMNAIDGTIIQSQGSFIDEGFRAGQTYTFKDVNNSNVVTATYTGTIISVTDLQLVVTGLPNVNNSSSQGSIWCIFVEQTRKSIELALNYVENENPNPSLESLIDGETTRFVYNSVDSLTVSSQANLTQVGKKSGGYAVSNCKIKRIADTVNPYGFTHNRQNFEITYDIIFIGAFVEDAFVGVNCLKLFSKLQFKVNVGETFGVTTINIQDKADTGWFDTGFNSEISNVTSYTTDANELYYNEGKNIIFTITTNTTSISTVQIGGCYITLDENLNLNKAESQESYLPFVKSPLWNATNIDDYVDSSADYFTIALRDFSYVDAGGTRTFTIEIEFLPAYGLLNRFGSFIEGRGDSDRLFYIWCKVGNTNVLVYGNQLEYKQPVGVLITPDFSAYVNHDNNQLFKDLSEPTQNLDINVHDNIAVICDFNLSTDNTLGNVIGKIVCFNNADSSEFVLDSITYDCSNQDPNNWVELSQNLSYSLPLSSNKQVSYLALKNAVDRGDYTLRLYYPFMVRWEDYLTEFEANNYFKSQNKANKNWVNYQTSTYELRFKLEIERNGVYDYFYKDLVIYDYDDSTITSNIKIYDSTGTKEYNTIIQGNIYLIKATHVHPTSWSGYPWGDITIEPQNGKPMQLMSTEIDCDKNNALYGINNDRLQYTLVSSNTIELTCLFDSNKVNSKFMITSKISEDGQDNNHLEETKLMEDGTIKLMEDLTTKITD